MNLTFKETKTVKFIWLMIFFHLTVCNAHAQFAVKAGASASTYHGLGFKTRFLYGKIFGVSYTHDLGHRLSLSTGSIYTEKGTKMLFHTVKTDGNNFWFPWKTYRQKLSYMEFPLSVNLAIVNREALKFKIGLGGYLDVLLGAHKSPRPYPDMMSVKPYDSSNVNEFDFKKTSRGLLVTAEADLKVGSKHYALVELRYNYGTSRLNKPIYGYYQLPGNSGWKDLYKYYDSSIFVLLGITL